MILSGSYVTKRSIGRWKIFYQEFMKRACTLYFIIVTVRSAMLDIAEYKMMNREGWLELYQTNTRSNTIKTVVIYSLIFNCLFIIIQGQEAGPDTYGQS